MPRSGTILTVFLVLLVSVALLTALSPSEAALGANARLAYLHGAWVWTALAAIVGAGVFFWVPYLPLSLWTMQANWNGLFLDEPRWRIGVHFAVGGLLIQAAILVLGKAGWASLLNVFFAAALVASLARTEAVMHPASPILSSGSALIRSF